MGDEKQIERVENMMPRKVKKRRQIQTEDGVDAGWEEYYDYIFPPDQAAKGSFKLLEAAARWKQRMAMAAKEAEEVIDTRDDERADESEGEPEKDREGDSDTDLDDSSSGSSTSSDSSDSEDEK